MKLSNQARAVIIIVLILLTISFYESRRAGVLAAQIGNPVLRSLSLAYAGKVERMKSFLGLKPFFDGEEKFWQYIKEMPENLVYELEITPKPTTAHKPPIPFSAIKSHNI